MSIQKDYYAALGLPAGATPEQVKKRYRDLVRRYHPDVNASQDAAQRILVINEAYHTLGDVEKRSNYDANRILQQNASAASSSGGGNGTGQGSNSEYRSENGVEFNGFGRTYPQAARTAQRKAAPVEDPQTERLLMEAKLAYVNRQFPKAEKLCIEVLKIGPRNAVAHELLGDIYSRQGDTTRACAAYSYATQFNPLGRSAQHKLEQLIGNRISPMRPSTTTFTSQKSVAPVSPFSPTAFAALSVVSFCTLTLALIALFLSPWGVIANAPLGVTISWALFPSLLVEGVCGGILLAFYGRLRPARMELWKKRLPEDPAPVKMGTLLSVSSLLSFYLSFVVWIVVGLAKKPLSVSILRAYALSFAMLLMSAFAYHPSSSSEWQWAVLAFGGNLLFPALLLGWHLGDRFRLKGQSL